MISGLTFQNALERCVSDYSTLKNVFVKYLISGFGFQLLKRKYGCFCNRVSKKFPLSFLMFQWLTEVSEETHVRSVWQTTDLITFSLFRMSVKEKVKVKLLEGKVANTLNLLLPDRAIFSRSSMKIIAVWADQGSLTLFFMFILSFGSLTCSS